MAGAARVDGRVSLARRTSGGFTLIELLIVIVILGILAGIAIFAMGQFRQDSSTASCTADRRTIGTAITGWAVKHGHPPAALTDLTSGGGYLHDDSGITALQKSGDGYTLTYDPATGTMSDCPTPGATAGGPSASVTGCSPSTVTAGGVEVISVAGSGFNATDADVAIPGVTAITVLTRSSTSLSVRVTVPASAATGPRSVTVSSAADGTTATRAGCFSVA